MKDNRPRYKGQCCKCGKVFYACKSLGIETGWLDVGYGRCIECDEDLALRFNEADKTVEIEPWMDYINSRKLEVGEESNE